ncbi:MAG: sugar phosphate nucleotidyltransferase [Bacteroidota bacterium]|nr:sugar phosphate nucleotidyltransferase [Bacteroidota bacterium]
MSEFLGVLFCGGRGRRLGEITKYISKSFIPVYDKPVFKFGLELLEKSKIIKEIVILTNKDNDSVLNQSGYKTIIQEDSKVNDMLSGWKFIKEITKTKKNGVLVPSDNICEVKTDLLIKKFLETNADFLFSLHKVSNKEKLSQMGCFDIKEKKFYYRNSRKSLEYGVIAPYIIKNVIHQEEHLMNIDSIGNIFESSKAEIVFHEGYWFDTGDCESILEASGWRQKNK